MRILILFVLLSFATAEEYQGPFYAANTTPLVIGIAGGTGTALASLPRDRAYRDDMRTWGEDGVMEPFVTETMELWTLGSSLENDRAFSPSRAHAVIGLSGADARDSTTSRRHVESEDDAVATLTRRSTGRPNSCSASLGTGSGLSSDSTDSSSSFPATPAIRSIRAVFLRSRSMRESDG